MRVLLIALIAALTGCGVTSPTAPPSFFALGGEVHHANDRHDAAKQELRFVGEPRWFAGFPKEVTEEQFVAWEKKQGSFNCP